MRATKSFRLPFDFRIADPIGQLCRRNVEGIESRFFAAASCFHANRSAADAFCPDPFCPFCRAGDTIVSVAEFASLHSYWEFERSVKAKAKCASERVELFDAEHDEETREFLRIVLETSQTRRRRICKISRGRSQMFFRAQTRGTWTTAPLRIGEDEEAAETADVVAAHPLKRMVPKAEEVEAGRLNRKGVPCLYLASTASAAMAEMRPWVGSYITLAQFELVRDSLVVVDCSLNTAISHFLEVVGVGDPSKPDAATKETGVWGDIGFACSKPVTRDEPRLNYIPKYWPPHFTGRAMMASSIRAYSMTMV